MTGENRMDALFSYQKPDRVPIGSLWMSSPSESNQVISPKHFQQHAMTQAVEDHGL
jgi:hypothetical protein